MKDVKRITNQQRIYNKGFISVNNFIQNILVYLMNLAVSSITNYFDQVKYSGWIL